MTRTGNGSSAVLLLLICSVFAVRASTAPCSGLGALAPGGGLFGEILVERGPLGLFVVRREYRAKDRIELHAGLGVAGDAHHGVTVQHRSHAARDPMKPNLRQVHLLHAELFDELRTRLTVQRGPRTAPLSMLYPLNVNNWMVAALNTAAELGAPRIDRDVVRAA